MEQSFWFFNVNSYFSSLAQQQHTEIFQYSGILLLDFVSQITHCLPHHPLGPIFFSKNPFSALLQMKDSYAANVLRDSSRFLITTAVCGSAGRAEQRSWWQRLLISTAIRFCRGNVLPLFLCRHNRAEQGSLSLWPPPERPAPPQAWLFRSSCPWGGGAGRLLR